MKSFKNFLLIITLLIFGTYTLLLTGCGRSETEASNSIEQIHEEVGIPVKTETLELTRFEKDLSFFSKLSGIKEGDKLSLIGGKIEKIRAKVGEYVKKDQIIIEFAIDNPRTQYEQAKTAFENSEKIYLRTKALFDAGETSQANFDGVQTQYFVDKRNYESQKQMLFIESPFDGILVDLKVNEGDNIMKPDIPLFTVSQLNKMRTKIWASEDEIHSIKKGMTAITDFNNKTFTGKVTEVSLAADPMKQAFYAEVEFDNPKGELKSGVTVETKILVYENPKAIIVPRNLVKQDQKGNFVFVEKNGIAEKRYVKNGNDSGINYEVKSGLVPGEKLITNGAALLEHGKKVKVVQ